MYCDHCGDVTGAYEDRCCDHCHRRITNAETTASENRPPAAPHIAREDIHYVPGSGMLRSDGDSFGADYLPQATDGHGESVDEMRRRLPDTPEARVGLTCRVHGCNDLTDDSGSYCAWHGPDDLTDPLDELRFRITSQGFNALRDSLLNEGIDPLAR